MRGGDDTMPNDKSMTLRKRLVKILKQNIDIGTRSPKDVEFIFQRIRPAIFAQIEELFTTLIKEVSPDVRSTVWDNTYDAIDEFEKRLLAAVRGEGK